MNVMKYVSSILLAFYLMISCSPKKADHPDIAERIRTNPDIRFVKEKALEVVKTGFNAGDGYREVWIRDYNTFIELSCEVFEPGKIEENLLVFFRMQGNDGNIMDGFIPVSRAGSGYDYIFSDLEPRYAGHKNTVETDQESSLVQAVYKYVKKTGHEDFLKKQVDDKTVSDRLEWAMEFLINQRLSEEYGLLWGATTADWGDVQPEHEWGVYLTADTHYAIDIYDNAMFLIALDQLMELIPGHKSQWQEVRNQVAARCREYLWDEYNQKFIPHIYLDGSPFPTAFNENEIYYHGGTAIAIEAGLLSREEVGISLQKMKENVQASGAASIGLTLYPPYPEGFFQNPGMYPYAYQNGGDWTWFGGRMIQQLVRYGFLVEAYENLLPMIERVRVNDGFYEWYTLQNEPKGSGTFRGSAGVLYTAITLLEMEADSR
jgi:glycogen debranching enzyme